ncbi:MAG: hypothetical protein L7H12_03760 [Sulfolobales archaeon]|nr:hypothetical protein [Sulfolobales archaeon]MCG2883365.1 hypothetical protein [Sulfolobales archaeon]MCG2908035.1 hypothetical protein [Sulfolobales archaeon]MCQ4384702.1 hypothetical protein [Sulfolobales archaeon]
MSTEKQEKKEYPDFLRQVVVRVLTPNKLDPVKLEDARKILGKAETKYKFSSFGGDPQNLVVFLLSPEFTDLILVIGVQLSLKLLDEIEKEYDIPAVKEAVKKIREELQGYESLINEKITLNL